MDCGYTIGLHFDETRYPKLTDSLERIKKKMVEKIEILSMTIGHEMDTVSMRRPSKELLEYDLQISEIVRYKFLGNLNICLIPEEDGVNRLMR